MKRIQAARAEILWALVTCLLLLAPGTARAQGDQKIEVLVNDEPISVYDISQRTLFMALSTRQQLFFVSVFF